MPETEKSKSGTGLKELLKLYRFLKPYRWIFALGMLFLLISSGASLMFPKFLGDMVDIGTKGKILTEINRTGLILLAILVTQALFSYLRTRIFVLIASRPLRNLSRPSWRLKGWRYCLYITLGVLQKLLVQLMK